MRLAIKYLCIAPLFFLAAMNIVAQPMDSGVEQSGLAVRFLREEGRLECIDTVKSFERLLAISADQAGYRIFGNKSNDKPHEGLINMSINSFLGGEKMHSTLVVDSTSEGCNLFGQRVSILKESCKTSLKMPRFNGASLVEDQSGALIIRDADNVNKGFMIEGGGVCAYIEALSRVGSSNLSPSKSLESDTCARAVKDFKMGSISRGVDYPVLSGGKNVNAGIITQKNNFGTEMVFYASSHNATQRCEIAAEILQLFPRDCASQKELIPELKALNIKARSKSSFLLDVSNNIEIEMSDAGPNACLVSVNRVFF